MNVVLIFVLSLLVHSSTKFVRNRFRGFRKFYLCSSRKKMEDYLYKLYIRSKLQISRIFLQQKFF